MIENHFDLFENFKITDKQFRILGAEHAQLTYELWEKYTPLATKPKLDVGNPVRRYDHKVDESDLPLRSEDKILGETHSQVHLKDSGAGNGDVSYMGLSHTDIKTTSVPDTISVPQKQVQNSYSPLVIENLISNTPLEICKASRKSHQEERTLPTYQEIVKEWYDG